MTLSEIQQRNYLAAIRRGKIAEGVDDTNSQLVHLYAEVAELSKATKRADLHDMRERYIQVRNSFNSTMNQADRDARIKQLHVDIYGSSMAGTIEDELADVILVCLSIAKIKDIDLCAALHLKVLYNENRD